MKTCNMCGKPTKKAKHALFCKKCILIRHRNASLAWQRKYPRRKYAHAQVARALACGEMVRPDTCAQCGSPDNIIAHHPDYRSPLKVEWLCEICHKSRHHRKKAKRATSKASGMQEMRTQMVSAQPEPAESLLQVQAN